MLLSLEDGLNKIFRTSWTPISLKRLVSYFVITLVSPMIFIIVCGSWIYITQIMPIQYAKLFSLSHSMTALYFISRFVPYLLLYLALFCCYAFLPRVAIQKTSALISTLIIGSVWIVFQKAFFSLQVSIFNYSFTYGRPRSPAFIPSPAIYLCNDLPIRRSTDIYYPESRVHFHISWGQNPAQLLFTTHYLNIYSSFDNTSVQ
ncbi:Inner membrane protein YihY [Chlamydia pneumoniae B21]|nr:Inner membrane protein YihY [Chlamydia pneumoniae B21]